MLLVMSNKTVKKRSCNMIWKNLSDVCEKISPAEYTYSECLGATRISDKEELFLWWSSKIYRFTKYLSLNYFIAVFSVYEWKIIINRSLVLNFFWPWQFSQVVLKLCIIFSYQSNFIMKDFAVFQYLNLVSIQKKWDF